jgi:3-hydroxybutyryl-CoA dehydrogenase
MTLAVVGAGNIGASVAHAVLEAGQDVVLVDLSERALSGATEAIRGHARLRRLRDRSVTASSSTMLEHLRVSTELDDIAAAAFLIENITEDVEAKLDIHRRIGRIVGDDVVIAVNTSAIPMAVIASASARPANIVGMHFMNPVAEIDMVELVRGPSTSRAALECAIEFVQSLDKEPIVVNDSPGFVINRVLMLAVNEAARIVTEGVANVADVDRLFVGCLGHRMGPLRTADLIGLDTIVRTLDVLDQVFGASYAAAPILREMVDRGELGRKSGRGFFVYGMSLSDLG